MRFWVSQNRKTMTEDRIIITDELLAAFLDGNVSGREAEAIMKAAAADSSLRETISILSALAADAPDKLCAIHCERYVLQCFGISSSVEELLSYASGQGLIEEEGMPLGNVGRVSEHYGLFVENKFASGTDDIIASLSDGNQVIAAVDVGELDPALSEYESLEDVVIGPRPDHCVVVLSCDPSDDEIVCYDPSSGDVPVTISITAFLDAWKDSENYMVSIGR